MVSNYWNFTAAPFDAALEPATFYTGAPQEEALARLEWIVDERQRFALVVGVEGCGKSHLASMATRRLGGLGAESVMLSLRGLTPGDWLEMLVGRLPLDAMSRGEPLRPWQQLENRLRENTLMERTTAMVFDDIDDAPSDALDGIVRLISAAEPRYARTVVVATATLSGLSRLPAVIRQRAAVRIELGPWDAADVSGFLSRAIQRVGGKADVFSSDAAATLARFSGGVPRVVSQLAHLSLVAAAGDALPQVDPGTVERTWRELSPSGGADASDAAVRSSPGLMAMDPDERDELPVNPHVRVVRRLWG